MPPEKQKTVFTGALTDKRPLSEQDKDVHFEELVGEAAPVVWTEKPETAWRKFPVFDQKRSSMCGAFSMAKLMGIYFWLRYKTFVDFSPEDIYQRRYNRPGEGMAVDDLYKIVADGVTLKQLTGATIETDTDADSCFIEPFKRDVGRVFQMGDKVVLPNNIDTIASTIQKTGKAVHLFTFFWYYEYDQLIPKIEDKSLTMYTPNRAGHFVVAVDFTLKDGVKYLVVEDSAHFGGLSRRLLSEEWIRNRVIIATYPMKFKFEEGPSLPPAPTATPFKETLRYSRQFASVPDVVRLQDTLKMVGVFPANIESTGWYGPTTCRAVMAFQRKFKVAPEAEIVALQGEVVGPKTIAMLNALQSN